MINKRLDIDKILNLCRFPPLSEKYLSALRDAVTFILENYCPTGIIVSGSIIRGNPDASSDLDIYCIHRENFRQRVQKFFRGIPAEIFVNPPSKLEEYFEDEHKSLRPCTAHMITTGFVILERDPVIKELRTKALKYLDKTPEVLPFNLTMNRYMAATALEDALDTAEKDPATAEIFLGEAVLAMINYLFKKNGVFIPRKKELMDGLEALNPNISGMARDFYTSGDLKTKIGLAEKIADLTIETRGFFEWESKPE